MKWSKYILTSLLLLLLGIPFNLVAKKKSNIDSIILKDYYSIKTYWEENKELPDNQFKQILKREAKIEKNIIDNKPLEAKKIIVKRKKNVDKKALLDWHTNNFETLINKEKPAKYSIPVSYAKKNELDVQLAFNTKEPKQGTTLAIYLKGNKNIKIYKALLGNRKITFNEIHRNLFRALIPFDVIESPGEKKISIKFHDMKQSYQIRDTIKVISRNQDIVNKKKRLRVKRKKRAIKLRFSRKKSKLLTHTDRYKERYFFYEQFKEVSSKQYWDGTFIVPIKSARINSKSFGRFRKYIGRTKVLNGYHRGIDIAKPRGTSVFSSNQGKVVIAGKYKIRGNAVVIDHGRGVYSCYFHMSKVNVKKGAYVKKGQKIGEVGSTGLSTGNHLHWEIRLSGISVNPIQWCQYDFNKKRINQLKQSNIQLVVLGEQKKEFNNQNIVFKSTQEKEERRPGKSSKYDRFKTIDNFR